MNNNCKNTNEVNEPIITFSTCFYILKAKFNPYVYVNWMNNLFSLVNEKNNFNLVIYTDVASIKHIKSNENIENNPRVRVVIKRIENFYNYVYKEQWIKNHYNNYLLKDKIDWRVNMLWNEKIWFVKETIDKKYFNTEYYGWCDIGYFRNRENDYHTNLMTNWPNKNMIKQIDKNKVHYACVNNDENYLSMLFNIINNKNDNGLPINDIPANQISIAGGFFILHKNKINSWLNTYEKKLKLYFNNNKLIKDDQIIIIDCIFSDPNNFELYKENNKKYDNWFLFQRILL